MNPLTPSLSPSEGERVPEGRVRGFNGRIRSGKSLPWDGVKGSINSMLTD